MQRHPGSQYSGAFRGAPGWLLAAVPTIWQVALHLSALRVLSSANTSVISTRSRSEVDETSSRSMRLFARRHGCAFNSVTARTLFAHSLVLLLLALFPRIAQPSHVASCGSYQTCNEVYILKFDATPQYRPEGEPVHVSLQIFEFANWLSTVSTMTFRPFVIGNMGQRVIPGSTVQTFNDGPYFYGAGLTYWFVQNTEWAGSLDWDGLDSNGQEVTEPTLLTVTVSAGAASVMRAVPIFVTPGKNLGKPLCPAGNPCDLATGNKYQEEIDVVGSALTPGFTRHYNHMGGTDLGLGVGWTSEYHQQLRPNGDKLTVVRADGRRERMTKAGSSWVADPDSRLKIVSAGEGFALTLDTGTRETYNALGVKSKICCKFRSARSNDGGCFSY